MKLTPFEEYMWVDDRPAYPMVFFYRLRFVGAFNVELFGKIVQQQARMHERFSSTIAPTFVKDKSPQKPRPRKNKILQILSAFSALFGLAQVEQYVWVATETEVEIIRRRAEKIDVHFHTPHLDLAKQVGLRLFVTESLSPSSSPEKNEVELLFQVHHACCDGAGFAIFLTKCLEEYAAHCGANSALDSRPTPSRGLALRGNDGLRKNELTFFSRVARMAFSIAIFPIRCLLLIRFGFVYWRKSAPLLSARPPFNAKKPHQLFPGIISHSLNIEALARLKIAVKKQQVTLTEFFICQLYLTIFQEQKLSSAEETRRPIRLSIPINLRDEQTKSQVKNVVSMFFWDRYLDEKTSSTQFFYSVRRSMRWGKWLRGGETFLWGLRILKLFPQLLPHVVRDKNRCMATTVLSNLGHIFGDKNLPRDATGQMVCGEATLESVEFLPPIRGWTAAGIGINTYAGTLTFSLHYDTSRMTQGEAKAFLEIFMRHVSEL